MPDPLRSNFLNNSIADFAMEENVILERVVDVEDDSDDYDDEESLSSNDSSSDDEMDDDDFCGSYGSPPLLGRSPLPSMSPPPLNWEEIDRQQMFEDFENQPMLFGNTSANNENSDKGDEEEDSAIFPATDRTVPTSASVLTVQPNNNNHPS